jgi:hypothetical protein
MADGVWCTYAEAAARLNVTSDAVRRRAIRRNWARRPGNDGKARILIPEDLVPHTHSTCAPPDRDVHSTRTPHDRPDTAALVDALQAHVETLKAELARTEQCSHDDRAAHQIELAQAEQRAREHRADLEHERVRADLLIAELQHLREALQVALTPWWRRSWPFRRTG